MLAPQGNFIIAQFKKIFDNPDVNNIMGECWDIEVTQVQGQQINLEKLLQKLEEFVGKLYSLIYNPQFHFDHVFPTRSSPLESNVFKTREVMIKKSLLPSNSKHLKDVTKAQTRLTEEAGDYKPFNIQEMDVQIGAIDSIESKQDELLKMYQQMGLIG